MAADWTQLNPATATTGSILGGDFLTLGTTTDVFVQRMKVGYGTDSAYTDTATNAPFPVLVETMRATGTVNIAAATGSIAVIQPTATELNVYAATGSVLNIQQMSTATSPVSVGTWTATGIVRIDTHSTATLPVSLAILPTTATLPVTVATTPVFNIQQMSTATSPVSLLTLPTTATLPVAVATGFIFSIQQMSTATSPVSVGTWTATGIVRIDTHSTATLPVSLAILPTTATLPVTVATSPVFNIQQMSTATSPVSIGTWTATGIVRIDTHSTATLPVSLAGLPTTATMPVVMANTATVNVANTATVSLLYTATRPVPVHGFWAHDATSTGNPVYIGGIAVGAVPAAVATGDVVNFMADIHGRQVVLPFSPRVNVVQYYMNASATTNATLATGSGTAGRFRDLIGMVVTNAATTLANVSIISSSTATSLYLSLAGDGGGISLQPTHPWVQAIAATNWVVQLATALVGKIHFSAQFHETT